MLDTDTKRRIDTARDILVGKVPDPKSQVEQITIALIYKFMDDMDAEAEELGGKRSFFAGEYARYGWAKLMRSGLGGHETLALYAEAITKMPENPGIPALFRDIFKNAYLPYRDPETLRAFLKIIDEFSYDHSERLGDAFEYLLSVLGSQGDAGQFRTPRHIIDFMVEVIDPKKSESVLDPACGTAGYLISSYKHILRENTSKSSPPTPLPGGEGSHYRGGFDFSGLKQRARELRKKQTEAETLLWELLRNRQLCNAKFRRQHQFGDYICDFYSNEAKLVVECDGAPHDTPERRELDAKRDRYLKSQGLTVLRFPNQDILNDPGTILEKIAIHLQPELPSPSGRGAGGEGVGRPGDLLSPDEKSRIAKNFKGYDISPDMVRLSLVNLYLHGFTEPHVYEYDTLTSEERWNEFSDVILANPPFMSPKGGIKPHKRFSIQAKRSEVLFVDYMAEHLTPQGRAAIIVPEGIIFQSQGAYKELRKMLVENSLVAVISLPAGCFNPYSGVKTSILILDKALARQSDSIAFFKVENDGFGLGAQRRAIEKNDLPQVKAELATCLQALRDRKATEDLQPTCGLIVPKEKIAANGDYNLSAERYRAIVSNGDFSTVRLGDVCERIMDGTHFSPKSTERGEFRYITAKNIKEWGLSLDDVTYLSKSDHDEIYRRCPVKKGDVLYIKDGATTGVATINPLVEEFSLLSSVAVLRGKEGVLDNRFLARYLNSPIGKKYMLGMMSGVAISRLTLTKLNDAEIPLPPLVVQQEIVAEIEGYQKVINGARAVLDHYRPHIPIHPEWPKRNLGSLAQNLDSRRVPITKGDRKAGPFPYYGASGIVDSVAGFIFDEDILLISEDGANLLARSTPIAFSVSGKCWVNNHAHVLKFSEPATQKFVEVYLNSISIEEFVTGAAQPKVNQEALNRIPIPIPDDVATQRAIVAEIEAEQALVSANRELITRFEQKIQATLARVWGEEKAVSPEP